MTKRMVVLLVALLVVAIAVPAYAAITDEQQKAITDLFKQKVNLQKQIIQKYVDAGVITKEQGKLMQDRMDLMLQAQLTNPNGFVPGACLSGGSCGGFGGGMMGGFKGRGMMGGFGGFGGFGTRTQSF